MAKWLKDSVIYQILIDRFSTGNVKIDKEMELKTGRKWIGGRIRGIIKNIKHIKKVANVIYISPPYKSSEYHGYSIEDPFSIDPHFGSENDLKELIEVVHRNDMKIILDFVPNHLSRFSPIFLEAVSNKNSKYTKWFVFKKWPEKYLTFLDVEELPKLNLRNKETEEYVISAAEKWVRLGIDGFRLDHAIGPPLRFWKNFRKRVKKINKQLVLIGEGGKAIGAYWGEKFKKDSLETIWILDSFSKKEKEKIEKWAENPDLYSCLNFNDAMMKKLESVLDGCIDFSFRDLVWALSSKKISISEFWDILEEHYKKFKKTYSLISLLSNHDCGRFSQIFGKKLAIVMSSLQFLVNQPALIYYGEEIGLRGRKFFEDCRRFMTWEKSKWDKELFEHYQLLFRLKTLA